MTSALTFDRIKITYNLKTTSQILMQIFTLMYLALFYKFNKSVYLTSTFEVENYFIKFELNFCCLKWIANMRFNYAAVFCLQTDSVRVRPQIVASSKLCQTRS